MKQKRRSKEEWKKIVIDFIKSGTNKKDYCDQKELKKFSFNHWYYKLRSNTEYKNEYDTEENRWSWTGVCARKQAEEQVTTESRPDFIRLKVEASKDSLQYEQEKENNEDSVNQSIEAATIKITLRSGIKIEVITNNILKLVKELNYVV